MRTREDSYKKVIGAGQYADEENYWLEKLSGVREKSGFPYDFPVSRAQSGPSGRDIQEFRLDGEVYQGLVKLANRSDLRLHILLTTGLFILVHKYADQDDITIGTPVLKQETAAQFINTVLALRQAVSGHSSFKQLVLQVRQTIVEATEHQNYPLEALSFQLDFPQEEDEFPLFSTAILLLNIHDRSYLDHIPIQVIFGLKDTGDSLTGTVEYDPGHYRGSTIRQIVTHYGNMFSQVLAFPDRPLLDIDILSEAERKQLLLDFNDTDFPLPAGKTLQQLFHDQKDQTPDQVALVVQVGAGGGRLAETEAITYRELDRQAGCMAQVLAARGLGPGVIAAIMIDMSLPLAAGILAILKAGAAYLPIDPHLPQERIDYMLADSGAEVVIDYLSDLTPQPPLQAWRGGEWPGPASYPVPERGAAAIPGTGMLNRIAESPQFVKPQAKLSTVLAGSEGDWCESPAHVFPANSDPAYVIYTSGSTGRPKGVAVEHRQVVNTLLYRKEAYRFDSRTTSLQLFSYAFDGFVTGFFTPLISGARLILIGENQIMDIQALKTIIVKFQVSHFIVIPALYGALVEELTAADMKSLQIITLAGDRVLSHVLEKTRDKNPDIEVVNEYGVTEAAVMSTIHRHQERFDEIRIGRPIWNTRVYIRGRYGQVQPLGVPGELCILGQGVARGYLNNPELTAERFVDEEIPMGAVLSQDVGARSIMKRLFPGASRCERGAAAIPGTGMLNRIAESPQFVKPQAKLSTVLAGSEGDWCVSPALDVRLYKTGDLARRLADGEIELLGRLDQQVKVRGFRIELSEIENRLLAHDCIKEAVVASFQDPRGDNYLCAYIVTNKTGDERPEPDSPGLREYLAHSLPEYMIPAFFIPLDQIPLTPTGKIDRSALPIKEFEHRETFQAPRDEIEQKMAELWAEELLLDKDKISIDANFFELGGHSLKATVLISKLQKAFNVQVPMARLFETPTIRELSAFITGAGLEMFSAIEPAEEKEYYPLSPAQTQFYIQQQMTPQTRAFNISEIVVFGEKLDKERLQEIFSGLVQRHDSLRTAFLLVDDEPVQRVLDRVGLELEVYDIEGPKGRKGHEGQGMVDMIIQGFIRPFDLSRAPLIRVGLIGLENKSILSVDLHHIVSDAVSHEILIQEFISLYRGQVLRPVRLQYKDFSVWLTGKKAREKLKEHENYWLKVFFGKLPSPDMPIDFPRTRAVWESEEQSIGFTLDRSLSLQIYRILVEKKITLYIYLLAAYNVLLSRYTGTEDIIVGTAVSGRSHADLENVIGVFINMVALRNFPQGNKTFARFLEETRAHVLAAFEHQDYPFGLLVEKLKLTGNPRRTPLFDSVFQVQNVDAAREESRRSLNISPYRRSPGDSQPVNSRFEMVWEALQGEENIFLRIQYAARLYRRETIQELFRHFLEILTAVVKDDRVTLMEIEQTTGEMTGNSAPKREIEFDL